MRRVLILVAASAAIAGCDPAALLAPKATPTATPAPAPKPWTSGEYSSNAVSWPKSFALKGNRPELTDLTSRNNAVCAYNKNGYVYAVHTQTAGYSVKSTAKHACAKGGEFTSCDSIDGNEAELSRGHKGAAWISFSSKQYATDAVLRADGRKAELFYKIDTSGAIMFENDWKSYCAEAMNLLDGSNS